ncbi:hypothetical protein EMIHUDRAFT_455171 [Emiliania huxleyi CCMP1516]|uniref:Uncharacterized protein n=2 Tax=Emiliania huxleyi TaxID=2903 RepID=A0A0D3KJS1_EMIH1|nr:hypothetical protein EMIHUDRAFT_455171 [Emiliania huxleyi CCMP1516]EOD36006.1 hypothetical protein EMIHUDRAFT_455171 [Emiliania huxleyi CCMP1516]|eukprot:XP_005788435.1 hypothetical protein EMIHUDRAFT_455171 [Emiliania huxleyi CCMP1516]
MSLVTCSILADVETLASGSKGRTALAALVRHAASARCLHEWSAGSSPPRLSDEACARLMERTTDAPHASPSTGSWEGGCGYAAGGWQEDGTPATPPLHRNFKKIGYCGTFTGNSSPDTATQTDKSWL